MKALFNIYTGEIIDEGMQLCQQLLNKKYIEPSDFATLSQLLREQGKKDAEIVEIMNAREIFHILINAF